MKNPIKNTFYIEGFHSTFTFARSNSRNRICLRDRFNNLFTILRVDFAIWHARGMVQKV